MKKLKRYDIHNEEDGGFMYSDMTEHKDWEWVKYEETKQLIEDYAETFTALKESDESYCTYPEETKEDPLRTYDWRATGEEWKYKKKITIDELEAVDKWLIEELPTQNWLITTERGKINELVRAFNNLTK
jgi:hypothetical protein